VQLEDGRMPQLDVEMGGGGARGEAASNKRERQLAQAQSGPGWIRPCC